MNLPKVSHERIKKDNREKVTVTFFKSPSLKDWLGKRTFQRSDLRLLIKRICLSMREHEAYACFSLDNRQVIALHRSGQFVMM